MIKLYAKFLITLTFVAFSVTTFSQGFGVTAGANFSTISTDMSSANDWRTGFQAGVFGKFKFGDSQWALQPEVLYSTKGSRSTYDKEFIGGNVETAEIDIKTQYVSIPVLAVFNPHRNLNIYFGPWAAILLDGSIVESDPEIITFMGLQDKDDLVKEDFNNFDAGLQAGIGMDINPFVVRIDYSFGMINVAEEDKPLEMILEGGNNNSIQVSVGVLF